MHHGQVPEQRADMCDGQQDLCAKGYIREFDRSADQTALELKVDPGTEDGVFVDRLTHDRAVEKAMNHTNGACRSTWAFTGIL